MSHVRFRDFENFWTLSDFSWPNGKRYRKTVFFNGISVCEFTTPRAFRYDTRLHLLKKSILWVWVMSDFEISMIFGPCPIFPGQTVRDIDKPFSLSLSAYANSLLIVHFDTNLDSIFWKNQFYRYESCQISKFWSTLPQRFENFSRYIDPTAVSIVLNERTDFKLYLPRMV